MGGGGDGDGGGRGFGDRPGDKRNIKRGNVLMSFVLRFWVSLQIILKPFFFLFFCFEICLVSKFAITVSIIKVGSLPLLDRLLLSIFYSALVVP